MKKILQKVVCFGLLCTLLTGCTNIRTKITYTIYPLGYIIERLVGNNLQYQSIQSDNSIVTKATITDDYKKLLKTSKVLFHIGDLEPYYSTHINEIKESGVTDIDLSSNNAVYDFKRYTKKETKDGEQFVASPYYEGKAFDSIDMYEKDLCLWMDPITMLSMAKEIKDYLVQNNVALSSTIETNYKSLEEDLINIDAQYQNLSNNLTKNHERIRFASMSACFGSWQKAYGFEVYPIVLSRYGSLPNAEQLKRIEKRIQDDGVKYIAYESNMTEDMIDLFNTVQKDCNLTRIDLCNLSSLSDEENNAGKDYISISYENLKTLESIVEAEQ